MLLGENRPRKFYSAKGVALPPHLNMPWGRGRRRERPCEVRNPGELQARLR
jgi:hypothetical protein